MSQIGGAEMSEACRDFEQMAFHEKDRAMETITVRRSDSIATLAGALSKAQGSMSAASKDRKNPHFNSGYATLASVWDACREPLATNGLAVVQLPGMLDDHLTVETHLLHESGEFIVSTLVMPVDKMTAQGVGSSITYARRYALSAMVGVAPDDDDDGNAASQGNGQRREPAPPAKTAAKKKETLTPEAPQTREQLEARCEKCLNIAKDSDLAQLNGLASGVDAVFGTQPDLRTRALLGINWFKTGYADNPFGAAASLIATVYSKLEIEWLTKYVDESPFSKEQKQDLYRALRNQTLKIEEPQEKATAAA